MLLAWGMPAAAKALFRRSRSYAKNVWHWPGHGVLIILPEKRFVASEQLQFYLPDMEVELRFRTAFQMLGRHQSDVSRQQLAVEIMHRERRARKNKQNTARTIFTQGRLAPLPALRAPLIGSRTLYQP